MTPLDKLDQEVTRQLTQLSKYSIYGMVISEFLGRMANVRGGGLMGVALGFTYGGAYLSGIFPDEAKEARKKAEKKNYIMLAEMILDLEELQSQKNHLINNGLESNQ